MFAPIKQTPARIADAIDLAIDFATLGEYGLEPVVIPVDADASRCARPRKAGAESGEPISPLARALTSHVSGATGERRGAHRRAAGTPPLRRNLRPSSYEARRGQRDAARRRGARVELGAAPLQLRLPRAAEVS